MLNGTVMLSGFCEEHAGYDGDGIEHDYLQRLSGRRAASALRDYSEDRVRVRMALLCVAVLSAAPEAYFDVPIGSRRSYSLRTTA